jgi:uncharacterized membrane protein (DUF106 family)
MLEAINHFMVTLADVAFRPLLALPKDLIVVMIAVATSAIIVFIRPFATNQDMLGRCDSDKKRLKELMREAKKGRDKEALGRYRTTKGQIAMKLMKAEGLPLLIALIPLVFIFPWGMGRMGFHPPRSGEEVTVSAYFPASAVGRIAVMVPQDGLEAEAWIARIVETPDAIPEQEGMATWKVKGKARPEPYVLKIRYQGETEEMELLVGSDIYSMEAMLFEPGSKITAAELVMKEYRFATLIPGFLIPLLVLPPFPLQSWMIAYILIAFPLVFVLKALFKIY